VVKSIRTVAIVVSFPVILFWGHSTASLVVIDALGIGHSAYSLCFSVLYLYLSTVPLSGISFFFLFCLVALLFINIARRCSRCKCTHGRNKRLCSVESFFSERELKFMFAIMSSSVRLSSVCRLSVTFVRPTQTIEIFGNVSTL